ncbi:HEAT repeat domain-containing protein [Chamaesiphon sp. VAR_48_metabat_403]|uniref:HEAT repeat domain-containing protein n=1 Tax=Chamaesiphon sp. VAR_48_metabat_403 TaxID=2964700 RepID=UPI00286DFC88|nr:HEAT repeat domain-containing protein [Chamaesiphon sp. VAR_48_metabat_403]
MLPDPTLSSIDDAAAAAAGGMWSIAIDCLHKLPLDRIDGNDRVLDIALQILVQGDFEDRWQIAKIFPKLGEIAIQPLLNLVNDLDIDIEDRWFGARILGEFDRPQVVAALVDIIQKDREPELTAIAVGALTKIGTGAIVTLTAILATAAPAAQRRMAITVLAQIRHSQTIEPLISVIDDPDPQLRTLIIEALGSFHDPRIPPLLIAKLTDTAASVRKAAVTALSLRSDLAISLNLSQHLRPLLFDLDLAVCEATALGFARLPDPRVVTLLTELLVSDRTPTALKLSAILALGWIGSQSAVDSLVAALVDIDSDLAPEIIVAIGKTELEREYASILLIDYWESKFSATTPSPSIDREIATALGNLGNIASVPTLVKLSADLDDRVRLHAVAAIAKLSPNPLSLNT